MSSATDNANASDAEALSKTEPQPPEAFRDTDRCVLAGKLRPTDPGYWADAEQTKPLIRQSIGSTEELLDPPLKIPDPYGWMRDESRTDTRVLDHLNAENAYTEALTSHLGKLRSELYDEMVASIKETDHTVPALRSSDGYLYYSRTFAGKSYTSYCRAPLSENPDWVETLREWDGTAESPVLNGEVTYLDVNALAEGQKYCAVGTVRTSPPSGESEPRDSKLAAYTVDFSGNEVTGLYVKDIDSGTIVDHDPELECYGSLQWGTDDQTLFYLTTDDQKRPYRLYRRKLAEDGEDELLYQEDDELYWVGMSKSFDGKYLFVSSGSKETSETHFLDLEDPDAELQCVAPRRSKVLYRVSHRAGQWYITTNVGGSPNMKLMVSPAVADSQDQWKDLTLDGDNDSSSGELLFDGGYDRSISGITSFRSHSVATGREGGLPQVWFLTFESEESKTVTDFFRLSFEEDAYDVGLGSNLDHTADSVVVAYDSLVTPLSYIRIPLDNPTDLGARTVLKEKEVPGYDKSLYSCERVTVRSRDGETDIPVSIVYRSDVMEAAKKEGSSLPTHLYGYGSYNACIEASFRATRLALLNRGMVYAIAHVRGGGEMGRQWYEEPKGAKYLCKKNTFFDFVDVARWLTGSSSSERKITTPQQLSCEGRSAGGLLIGASLNEAPELFRAALLGVPFVDVVPTMIDASIPLTVVEWEEWGNPNEKKYHDYMMEYSPINNVREGGSYPSCLLTGGLHDPRVQYWEPAKFAAELRHQSSSGNPCCLKIDMAAGHFSASDRYKYLRELAFDFAFLLDQMGLTGEKE
eukprot:CAMPEP_0172370218 /NCGR_PEP_ID=MMETSP1060-20121228/36866_1 /TAXON_ID=37318 /ORGANISM="Pseudo-nitzschia pungens, Strain cf. cingulata" /LENGTH=806 /DNA_ID=CAMNT_0013095415 /DNA_START=407 /DNA_END=2827 /DNA_ORIENTATION=-